MKAKKLYKMAKAAYYEGRPLMSDARFDALEDYIRKIDPDWKELQKTGVLPIHSKVDLPVFMPSLDKLYPDDHKKINKFMDAHKDLIASAKLDGSSVLLTYRGGRPVALTTRGNGAVGKCIDHLIPALNLPTIAEKREIHMRCEAVISKKNFAKLSKRYDTARNLVNGLLNRKDVSPLLKLVDIVVLAVYNMPYYAGIKAANANGFKTVPCRAAQRALEAQLADFRESVKYETDGLVLISKAQVFGYEKNKRPKWAYAFKVNAAAKQSKVLSIEWCVQASGRLVPKLHIEALNMNGTTVSKVTGHNAKWCKDQNIGVGAVVEVVMAGDVIPKVVGVVKPAKFKEPSEAEWDGVHLVSTETNEPKRLATFLRALGIKGAGATSLSESNLTVESYLVAYKKGTLLTELSKCLGSTVAAKVHTETQRAFARQLPASFILGSASVVDGLGVRVFESAAALLAADLKIPSVQTPKTKIGTKTYEKLHKNNEKLRKFAVLMQKTLKIRWLS